MTRAQIAGTTLAAVLVLIALGVGYATLDKEDLEPVAVPPPATLSSIPAGEVVPSATAEDSQGFLYGRITTVDGAAFEGRLRWGGGQEAFWDDTFNGVKRENPWARYVAPERLPRERRAFKLLGFEIAAQEREIDLHRPLMVRFGDITHIAASGRDVRVTLKSGSVFDLDRLEASDFDDGVRVWDGDGGFVDLDSLRIHTIELLPTPDGVGAAASRLHGTVHTRHGELSGFIEWDHEKCLGSDTLDGRGADGELRLRFDTIRSISHPSSDRVLVTLLDGGEVELSESFRSGPGNRGIVVDDPRYGRVLVSWAAFERLDLSAAGGLAGSGPAYGDFPPGTPLAGSVTTRDGRRLTGRLVYDLDESETTDTLDAPSAGVDYTIPFGLVASIELPDREREARVALHHGETLELHRRGDLGERNAGLLVFGDGGEAAEYVSWSEVARVDLERPSARVPPVE